ncbi:hydroxymethylglutaryl-CoA synthase [Paraneptunicella aestuarii]|uniref:hydroxymethylglutaryl-CoA synthase n=1 Tax=Paraneptunicella aestuarii TaxID=2831148 RepID=UPI001E32239C|nr:hydroxymethylglutaryl-CoA synthase [Paraneptunicella aestuarii]UAA37484.1 hydroxymethylglutaryl-CoA synthase [Paraneptunicella aestuarii]
MAKIGINKMGFYIPEYYLGLDDLAGVHQIDPNKYLHGIGQVKMAVPAPDEDVVTMAANAAKLILDDMTPEQKASISTVIFATETGVDQSKSGAAYLTGMIDVSPNVRAFEIKQACYGATAGIQMACDVVTVRPHESVLVIASDIAKYEQNSPGECTQGAGAVAMVISQNPDIIAFDSQRGLYSEDVMDFWRPNHMQHALVDGELSINCYLNSMAEAYKHYRENGGKSLNELPWLCFHQPFTKMAKKAYQHLQTEFADEMADHQDESYTISQIYGKDIGNTYTASMYFGLISLLENYDGDMTSQQIGLFSYGSGCVGEFFSGTVQPNYRRGLPTKEHKSMLQNRERLSYQNYERFMYQTKDDARGTIEYPAVTNSAFRMGGVVDNIRQYQAVEKA